MTRTEEIIEFIQDYLVERPLEEGERILISTQEYCQCHEDHPADGVRLRSPYSSTCHLCGGSRFLVDAKTLLSTN